MIRQNGVLGTPIVAVTSTESLLNTDVYMSVNRFHSVTAVEDTIISLYSFVLEIKVKVHLKVGVVLGKALEVEG